MWCFWVVERHVTSSDLRSLCAVITSVVFHFINGADGGYASSRCAVFLKWLSEGLWHRICVRSLKAFDLMRSPSFQEKLLIKCVLREKRLVSLRICGFDCSFVILMRFTALNNNNIYFILFYIIISILFYFVYIYIISWAILLQVKWWISHWGLNNNGPFFIIIQSASVKLYKCFFH